MHLHGMQYILRTGKKINFSSYKTKVWNSTGSALKLVASTTGMPSSLRLVFFKSPQVSRLVVDCFKRAVSNLAI